MRFPDVATGLKLMAKLKDAYGLTQAQARSVTAYVLKDERVLSSLSNATLGGICVAAALKRGRQEKGWAQRKAAKQFGLARPTLSRYENAKAYPEVAKLAQILSGYDVHEQDLRDGLNRIIRSMEK